jgi:PPOX class probable F420-dependent enzyme
MSEMTHEEWRAFVLEGTRTGKLATTRANGHPHVTPVWFTLDGDDVMFTTGEGTSKGKALARDPWVSLCVDDERPPFSFVVVEGTATITDDPDELLRWATAIGGRYMGGDAAEAFGRRNAVPTELLVRVTPTKLIARAAIAD